MVTHVQIGPLPHADRWSASQLERLARTLEPFDAAEEADALLAPRGEHPAPYELEQHAAGDLHDEARQTPLAAHIERCASCRAEVRDLGALLEINEQGPAGRPLRLPRRL